VLWEIIKKEIKELVKTKRLLIIGVLFFIVTTALSVVSALYLEQGPNEMISSVLYSIVLLFVSLLAIMLSYDSIAGERSKGSLSLVLSKPVHRSIIFLGKFLAILLFSGLIFLLISSWGYWLNAAIFGEFPSGGEVLSAYRFFLSALLLIACWAAFGMFFSTLFKSPTTALVMVLILWILVLPMISEIPLTYYIAQGLMGPGGPGGQAQLELNLPAWAKVLYAFNPDNSFSELRGQLFGSSLLGFSVFNLAESFAALAAFFVIFLPSGMQLFRRLSLE
jgi:ABC-type transport system involved in multi-copper enzyme maturation permease subunit